MVNDVQKGLQDHVQASQEERQLVRGLRGWGLQLQPLDSGGGHVHHDASAQNLGEEKDLKEKSNSV